MHAQATTGSRDETITPRSRQTRRKPSLQALKPLVSPITNVVSVTNGTAKAHSPAGNTASKPIMDWFRKLGHGRRAMPEPLASSTTGPRTSSTTETLGKPVKEKSFRQQASSLGIRGTSSRSRKQQGMMTALETRRRSSHHRGSSVKSTSIRSSRPLPPFSPPRSTPVARYPRAATFMTRSDASPGSSLRSSTSRRSSSEHSLAESYLDVDDPDSRSFVPSMADEGASLRPFPPCSPDRRSSTPRSTSSIDAIRLGPRAPGLSSTSPLPPFPSPDRRRYSQSTTTTTHSSFAPSRTWTNDAASRGTRSVDTRPTTIISTLDLPQRAAHIAQVPPPQPSRPHAVGQIHRTLTWDSGLSASPSVPSPLGTSITTPHPRSILERPPPTTSYPCNVPRHSHPHPRDNPRPLARPEENASLLTLASSEFAQPPPAPAMISPRSPTRDVLGPPLVMGEGRYGTPDPDDASEDGDEEERYMNANQTPIMGITYPTSGTSSRGGTVSYFDRASSTYYFTGTGTSGGGASSHHAGRHMDASLRSGEDRASAFGGGLDDRASVTAMRRRGSWESGESSFSGAGAAGAGRGEWFIASAQERYSPSLAPFPGGDGGLAQSLGRLSVRSESLRVGEVA